jgi:cell division protein FtsW (lipid II flippase)
MRASRLSLFAIAIPAFAAGLLMLAIAGVGKTIWVVQLVAIGLTCALALVIGLPRESTRSAVALKAICVVTLAAMAAPLLGDGAGPERWLRIGPLNLYVAPLLLPSLLVACAGLRRHGATGQGFGLAALTLAGVVLAAQPDASQVLALLVATVVLCAIGRRDGWMQWAAAVALVLAAVWAFSRPDPLQPVPYVEGVFALALGHSLVAGAAVLAAAAALLGGLGWWATRHAGWLMAVSAYYGVLFACSAAGLTPAPLIGYGAGPLLGFGLLVAVASSVADGVQAGAAGGADPAPG